MKCLHRDIVLGLIFSVLLALMIFMYMYENLWKLSIRLTLSDDDVEFDVDSLNVSDESLFKVGWKVEYTNCAALFDGHKKEIAKYQTAKDAEALKPDYYIDMTTDCAQFTTDRNYIMEPLSEAERDFPVAFSILMYADIEQFERLLRAIYRPQNYYCIHVDLTSNTDLYQAVKGIAECFPNVYLTQTRVNVIWGKMSVLVPELFCMKLLFEKGRFWKYFINLTGQEFPLKTNYELVQILKAYDGANDVGSTRKSHKANKGRWLFKGHPPHRIIPTKGPVHVVLCRGAVEYILKDQKAKDLLKWVATTEVPDETFFATLNHNPHLKVPGSYTGVPETDDIKKPYLARFKRRIYRLTCREKWVRGICIFGVKDLPILAKRKELFANKFFWGYQRATVECLGELLYNRTRDQHFGTLQFNASWYGSLGFVVNQIKPDI